MQGIKNGVIWALLWIVFIGLTTGVGIIIFGAYASLVFFGSGKRAESARKKLLNVIMDGEKILTIGIQHRLFALINRRELLAITDSRVILFKRAILGGFSMRDMQWKDLHDATLEENIFPKYCGSNILFEWIDRSCAPIKVLGLFSSSAVEIYIKSQQQEQSWEEKRRIRSIEEVRAASGGLTIKGKDFGELNKSSQNITENLEDIKSLLDRGIISDAEFNEIKSKLLSSIR